MKITGIIFKNSNSKLVNSAHILLFSLVSFFILNKLFAFNISNYFSSSNVLLETASINACLFSFYKLAKNKFLFFEFLKLCRKIESTSFIFFSTCKKLNPCFLSFFKACRQSNWCFLSFFHNYCKNKIHVFWAFLNLK